MTEEEKIREWESYKARLEAMEDPHIDSQHSWNEIRKFRINAIEGLIQGKTFDYHKTPGAPYA